jgi:hypothetical protein
MSRDMGVSGWLSDTALADRRAGRAGLPKIRREVTMTDFVPQAASLALTRDHAKHYISQRDAGPCQRLGRRRH